MAPDIFQPDHAHAKLVLCAESDELIVVFGSRNRKNFELYKSFENFNLNKLFLLDETGASWYQLGVPNFGVGIAEVAISIIKLAKAHRIKKIICFGASMGGYAAIAVGALVKAHKVIAVSPQTKLNPGWPFTPEGNILVKFPDLRDLILHAKNTYFNIVSSSDMLDVYHAGLISNFPNVSVSLTDSMHNILGKLKSHGCLLDFLEFSLHYDVSYPLLPVFEFDCTLIETHLQQSLDDISNRNYGAAIVSLNPICLKYPDWLDAAQNLGMCHYHLREFDKALIIFFRLMRFNSVDVIVYPEFLAVLASQGLYKKADIILEDFLAISKTRNRSAIDVISKVAKCAFFAKAYSFCVTLRRRLINEYGYYGVDNLYALARALHYSGELAEAMMIFHEISLRNDLDESSNWMRDRSVEHILNIRKRLEI